MVGIKHKYRMHLVAAIFALASASGCVSTEELYAEYDALDCKLVVPEDATGELGLHEQITDTHYPWEPAVYFAFDQSELTAPEKARLDKSMQVLKQFDSLHIGLQGFTDKKGTSGYNEQLAQQRVLSVKAYLEENGIVSSRIFLQPIGEVLPQIDADENTARAVNRRVELMLVDEAGRPIALQYAFN